MTSRVHFTPTLIFSVGTQVVALKDVIGGSGRVLHPRGAVGVVIRAPRDLDHAYRVRVLDGAEVNVAPADLTMLARYKEGEIGDSAIAAESGDFWSA